MHGRTLMIEVGGIGGVTDYTKALVEALAAEGCEVELVTARDHRFGRPRGVRVHPIVPWVRERAPLGRLVRRAGLGPVVNALAFLAVLPRIVWLARGSAVVHLQGSYHPPLAALLALLVRAVGTPFVHTAHNVFDRGRPHPLSHALLAACVSRTIVHTQADREALEAKQGRDVAVIPHGEYGGLARTGGDADRAAARAGIGADDDEVVAILFGQLRVDKGVGDFLEAAAEVPDLRVIVAGEDTGGLSAVREKLTKINGRATVHEGFLPMATAARLFAAADVAVLPYKMASQSGVLLLSYGFERPVVTYPVGGLIEAVVDGETGWITAEASPEALARTLREVVAAGPQECARRGAAGKRLSEERYSWSVIGRATRGVYEAVSHH